MNIVLHHLGTRLIETDRLILRKFEFADAKDMFDNWANDPEVTKFLRWEPHGSIEVTEKIIQEWVTAYESDEVYNWAIIPKEYGKVIGGIGVVEHNYNYLCCEIGYCISKNYWGKGVTTEAVQSVIKFMISEVKINRIQAKYDTNNPASGKVMQKSGMTLEGTLRQAGISKDGTFYDLSIWSILADEYKC